MKSVSLRECLVVLTYVQVIKPPLRRTVKILAAVCTHRSKCTTKTNTQSENEIVLMPHLTH